MKHSPEGNPEHKFIIKIVDGLTTAEGACEQLIHRHGDGNLKFSNLQRMLEAVRMAVTAKATIPMFRDIKPWNMKKGYEPTMGNKDDQVVLAEDARGCSDGDGADEQDSVNTGAVDQEFGGDAETTRDRDAADPAGEPSVRDHAAGV